MRLNPAYRLPDETKEIYDLRRWTENRMIRLHLKGSPVGWIPPLSDKSSRRGQREFFGVSHRQAKKQHLYA